MKKALIISFVLCAIVPSHAQKAFDSLFVLPDTVRSFSLENLYASMLTYHPIVKQTELLTDFARQEVRLARGAFDPKLESRFSNKELDDKNYYNQWMATFTVPTWFPVNPKIGIERNTGINVNPENSIPAVDNYKQIFTGISMPIGRGLFTDERRAALQQAQLFTQLAEAEQIKLINKILLEAAKEYWQWFYSFYNYRLMDRNAGIAQEIFNRVKLNATFGEASVVDTVQAKITLQQRLVERQEAYLDFINSGIRISNYLWDADGNPLQLSGQVAPVLVADDGHLLQVQTLEELRLQAERNHPELVKIRVKLDQLEVDRKLAVEYLKPTLNLNYNFLNQPIQPEGRLQSFTFFNNYKFGLDFSIPILLRKERSKLAQTKIKIRGTEYERTQTGREIINQVNAIFNQLVNTNRILDQQTGVVISYERLLEAELLNLESGESDLFKINIQQEKLIQSQSKLLKLKADYEKMKAELYWAAGARNLNYQP
jgi:outer membrane protein TolC